MGFLMTVGIMIATIAYLWKRWRKTEGVKTAATRFALVFLYAIIAGGSLEKIWLGYLATLLLSAPIPSRRFVNWGHQMPAGQRHEFYYISKGEQVCPFITATRYFQGRAGVPFYYSDTVFPRASRCALLLQRHGISKGEQVCPFITATRYFQGRAGVSFITATRYFQGRAGVSFITATRYFQGRAGVSFTTAALLRVVFKAASLVMEPSCSGLMAVSPPGPADARIGMIGTVIDDN